MGGEFVRHGFVLPHWAFWTCMFIVPFVFLWFAHRRAKIDAALAAKDNITITEKVDDDSKKGNWVPPGNRFTRIVEKVCYNIGVFASLWTVICILFYVFEVFARYGFNAPTNWVHEASFLMFGVMYTLGGALLYQIDGHVRVDVFYSNWSPMARAGADIVTTVLFYVFILGMMFSGWSFFAQALDQNVLPSWIAQGYNFDLSASEWQIPYWPIKFAIPFGAFLVALIGASRFIKDVQTFRHYSEVDNG